MNPERREITEGWIHKAESDLAYANLGLSSGDSYRAGAVYHCHQTAEKALKALLCFYGIIPSKTHDLVRLIEILSPHVDLADVAEASVFLTPLATDFRYPGDQEEPTGEDAKLAFDYAQGILVKVRELIS